jgi:hypothetical protein
MRKNLASRTLGWLPLLLVLGPSCSLVYDLSPDQCGSNDDCVAHFGPGLTCDSGICTCHDPVCMKGSGGATSTGGSGGTGGTGAKGGGGSGGSAGSALGGTGGDAGALETGGSAATGTGGAVGGKGGSAGKGGKGGAGGTTGGTTGGTSAEGGMGGEPLPPECATHADCFKKYSDSSVNPRACVNQQCVPLKTDDCPIVLPLQDSQNGTYQGLQSTDAIILGAFTTITGSGTITRNYDLGITELSNTEHGVFAGGKTRREIVMVGCNWNFPTAAEVLRPAKHLIEDLNVKGIIGALPIAYQQYVFEQLGTKDNNDVFFMMPTYSDEQLINLQDDGLVWHMLSGADALDVSYQPLLNMTETHLRHLNSIASSASMKVALVTSTDEHFLADTGDYITNNVSFNGKLAKDNFTDGNFTTISTTSVYTDDMFDQTATVNSIVAFKPHVVIGATADEMLTKIIPLVESLWDAQTGGQDRPFYLLSPLVYNLGGDMSTLINNDMSTAAGKVPLRERMIGINWPSAVDQSNYNDYQLRYFQAYQTSAPGYENFYDAAYYLMYAVAGATQPLTGSGIAAGMLRLISGSQTFNVGPDDMDTALNTLNASRNSKFQLIGASGPPNWDTSGGRNDPGSVWCMASDNSFAPDVLRYNASTMMLDGTFSCFTFPAQ